MEKVKIFFVGIGGYGATNLDLVISDNVKGGEIVGVCDIAPEKSRFYGELVEKKVPFFKSMEEFFENNTADLTVISTPIHLHASQSIYAMRHGSNVQVEKPTSSTVEEALEMMKVSRETGKFINIGYQSSFMYGNVAFKRDIISGRFGKAKYAKALVLWPRTETYYGRSPWAGKLHGKSGEAIFDSVANNATAHYLHNMFYTLGGADNEALMPDSIDFELYRGNNIESFDTCALRAKAGDIDFVYLVSHATRENYGPKIEFGFEHATAVLSDETDEELIVTTDSGEEINYGKIFSTTRDKVEYSVNMCKDPSLPLICSVEATLPHANIIKTFHTEPDYIKPIPTEVAFTDSGVLHYAPFMDSSMKECFSEMKLPSEMGYLWASKPTSAKL